MKEDKKKIAEDGIDINEISVINDPNFVNLGNLRYLGKNSVSILKRHTCFHKKQRPALAIRTGPV